ncbi:MAG: hypothetical protein GFH27_549301n53 [Chloroflexi bacterium AL-W]|nr:hypothetical protein [Chloroflexi bacterium AL-N1]NOK68246.1 hypothetical protein [Chloroflexi bacterium AL-N10]NOK73892.1 hypothetical protein [Chloroflexi bacterium AL-N5]NOK82860.1 hypothetical protein [Chloroflexi bacterium AL-W]NOK90382.1 hypothetical protein [Chloroflexi bacterium AL-N15]
MTHTTTKRTLFRACTTWPSNASHITAQANKQLLRQQLFDHVLDYIGLDTCQVHLTEYEDDQMYALTIRLVWLELPTPLPLAQRAVGA